MAETAALAPILRASSSMTSSFMSVESMSKRARRMARGRRRRGGTEDGVEDSDDDGDERGKISRMSS